MFITYIKFVPQVIFRLLFYEICRYKENVFIQQAQIYVLVYSVDNIESYNTLLGWGMSIDFVHHQNLGLEPKCVTVNAFVMKISQDISHAHPSITYKEANNINYAYLFNITQERLAQV